MSLSDIPGIALSILREFIYHGGTESRRKTKDLFSLWLRASVVEIYLCAPTGWPRPASLASFAALSVASQVKSASERPKWP